MFQEQELIGWHTVSNQSPAVNAGLGLIVKEVFGKVRKSLRCAAVNRLEFQIGEVVSIVCVDNAATVLRPEDVGVSVSVRLRHVEDFYGLPAPEWNDCNLPGSVRLIFALPACYPSSIGRNGRSQ